MHHGEHAAELVDVVGWPMPSWDHATGSTIKSSSLSKSRGLCRECPIHEQGLQSPALERVCNGTVSPPPPSLPNTPLSGRPSGLQSLPGNSRSIRMTSKYPEALSCPSRYLCRRGCKVAPMQPTMLWRPIVSHEALGQASCIALEAVASVCIHR